MTIAGTVLRRFQFSGFWFAMAQGRYAEIAFDAAQAAAEAERLFGEFSTQPIWADCVRAVADARAACAGAPPSFAPGPQFLRLTPRTLLYFNPRVCAAPAWAAPDKLDATIFQHSFFHP